MNLETVIQRAGAGRRLSRDERAGFSAPIDRLLTLSNPKTAKGQSEGYLTAILHLAPHMGAGVNTCPAATVGCSNACLTRAGRGGLGLDRYGMNGIQRARVRKTVWYFGRRDEFVARLAREISLHVARAHRHGMKPAVRLNGTSDIRWETVPVGQAPNLMSLYPDVVFYDYTKLTNRRALPENYSLTLSAHEGTTVDDIGSSLGAGVNVAVVLRDPAIVAGAPNPRAATIRHRAMTLPREWQGFPVIDGDKSDLRFTDPAGVIVALRAKGPALYDRTGFVRDVIPC